MKTAFIETSAINYCHDNFIDGYKLRNILLKQNYLPTMGIYTTYELARCFVVNIEKAKQLFRIVKELNPSFICRSDQLYLAEIKKLKRDVLVNPYVVPPILSKLIERIDECCNGKFDEKHAAFICGRQENWNLCRKNFWEAICERSSVFNGSFDEYLKNVLNDLQNNVQKINIMKTFLEQLAKSLLTNDEVKKFILNIDSYPALRSLIYSHLWLDFQIENSKQIPREDRFTDSIQIIEASYSTALVSFDMYIINNLTQKLNTNIQPINIDELLRSVVF